MPSPQGGHPAPVLVPQAQSQFSQLWAPQQPRKGRLFTFFPRRLSTHSRGNFPTGTCCPQGCRATRMHYRWLLICSMERRALARRQENCYPYIHIPFANKFTFAICVQGICADKPCMTYLNILAGEIFWGQI